MENSGDFYEEHRKEMARLDALDAHRRAKIQQEVDRLTREVMRVSRPAPPLVFWSTHCRKGCTAGGWLPSDAAAVDEIARPCPYDGGPRERHVLPAS